MALRALGGGSEKLVPLKFSRVQQVAWLMLPGLMFLAVIAWGLS